MMLWTEDAQKEKVKIFDTIFFSEKSVRHDPNYLLLKDVLDTGGHGNGRTE